MREISRRNIPSESQCEFSISCTPLLLFRLCCLTSFLRRPFLLSLSLAVEWWPFEIALYTSLHLLPQTHTLSERSSSTHTHTHTLTLWHESQSQNSHPQHHSSIPPFYPSFGTSHLLFFSSSRRDWKCNGLTKWGEVTRKLERGKFEW